jgi:hypothetical protein
VGQFGFEAAVRLQQVGGNAPLGGNVGNGERGDGAGNVEVGHVSRLGRKAYMVWTKVGLFDFVLLIGKTSKSANFLFKHEKWVCLFLIIIFIFNFAL